MIYSKIYNLEVILSIEKDVYRLYANTTPFYMWDLSILIFLVWCGGVLEPIPHIYRRKTGHKTESRMCYKKNSKSRYASIHFFIHVMLSRVQLFVTLCTVDHQSPPSMRFPRQEYWSGFSFTPPGYLTDPEMEATSLIACIAGRFSIC